MVVAIVGASQAGLQIATSLRERGYGEAVVLIGDEPYAPYQRPPLSKGFLKGSVTTDMLLFRDASYYQQHAITLLTGELVVKVDRVARTLHMRSGREVSFDRLAIATGARARPLATEGADLPGVLYVRGLDDAKALSKRLETCSRIVVIGGGFMGLETAAMAADLGKQVVVLEAADRLMSRSLGSPVAEYFLRTHRNRGLDIRLGMRIIRIVGDAKGVQAVELKGGERVAAELVVVGVGSVASIDLAAELGLEVGQGIVVNPKAQTSVAEIVAAGDCTVRPLRSAGLVRLESVHNAIEQGKIAAATLLGQQPPPEGVPWFWSDQGKLKLQIAGLSKGFDSSVMRGHPEIEKFSVLYFREGVLIAAESVNSPGDHLSARSLISRHARISPQEASDLSVPLKSLVEKYQFVEG